MSRESFSSWVFCFHLIPLDRDEFIPPLSILPPLTKPIINGLRGGKMLRAHAQPHSIKFKLPGIRTLGLGVPDRPT